MSEENEVKGKEEDKNAEEVKALIEQVGGLQKEVFIFRDGRGREWEFQSSNYSVYQLADLFLQLKEIEKKDNPNGANKSYWG